MIARCRALIYLDVPDPLLSKRLRHRGGDNEAIETRLATFHQETNFILEHCAEQGKLIKIDARGEVNEICDSVTRAMEELRLGKEGGILFLLLDLPRLVVPSHIDWKRFQSKKFVLLVGGPGKALSLVLPRSKSDCRIGEKSTRREDRQSVRIHLYQHRVGTREKKKKKKKDIGL